MDSSNYTVILAGGVALLLALLLTPVWIRIAPRFGAVDHPRGRHKHQQPTPTAGGVAIFCALVIPTAIWGQIHTDPVILGVLLGAFLLVLLNIWDDIHGLPPAGRLLAQLAIASMVYIWGARIELLTNPWGLFGPEQFIRLGLLSAPLTVFWIVLITNALNWLDGLDGLAAGVAGISALTVAIMGAQAGSLPIAVTAACMAGSCLGFLKYNFNPARVFMGDTGAMCLGFLLACLSVLGAYKIPTAVAVLLPMLVMGVPLFDATSAIIKRIIKGKNPLIGDRGHIHHGLVDRGLPVRTSVLIIYAMTALLCLAALYLWWK